MSGHSHRRSAGPAASVQADTFIVGLLTFEKIRL